MNDQQIKNMFMYDENDCYDEIIDNGNKENFLKPGTFNIKELTWKMLSQGRGFVIYHFIGNTHKGIKYTFNYKYNDSHYLNICNENKFNKIINYIIKQYGEDCLIHWDGNNLEIN